MRLAEVVAASADVAATRLRTAKIDRLAEVIAAAPSEEVEAVTGFLSGEPRQGKVGVGYAALFTLEVEPAAEPSLEVAEVDQVIARLPGISGPGSQAERRELLGDLLARATADEQAFLRRLFTGEVRQGALEGMMVEAVARASGVDSGVVRRAVMLAGDLPAVARLAVTGGQEAVAGIGLEVGRPVRPMLASPGKEVATAMDAVDGAAIVEWKLDGARIQAHKRGGEVTVFTRNLNDVTARLPGVVETVAAFDADPVVLDGEAMVLDDDGRPRPFGETMSRFGRDRPASGPHPLPDDESSDDAPVVGFFFDALHVDGDDLIDRPLAERLEVLDRVVPPERRVPRILTDDPGEAEAFLAEARRLRHEGLMVKDPVSVYQAGSRGAAWRKVKPAHTLDLVVLAAEWGHGRRTGWLSNLHLGARDPEGGEPIMLGKTFKGLTDEMLAWQTERLLGLETRRRGHIVYVRPELVVEVAFDGVVASPRYPAGLALRFARVKAHRPDKDPSEADTIDAVRALAP